MRSGTAHPFPTHAPTLNAHDGGTALVNARARRIKYVTRRPRRHRGRPGLQAATIAQRRIACMLAARHVTPRIWRRRPY